MNNNQYGTSNYTNPNNIPKPNSSSGSDKKLIIICLSIVLSVAILAAAGVFAFILLNKDSADTTNIVQENAPETEGKKDSNLSAAEMSALDLSGTQDSLPSLHTLLVTVPDKSGIMADMIMMCIFDHEKKDITLLSIPRDTYVNGSKLNAISISGKGVNDEKLIRTVKELTGIPIHDFLRTDIDSVKSTVDLFGGVYYTVPRNMKYSDPSQGLYIDLKKGNQLIDGNKAEQLLRFRGYPNADIGRTETQRKFMIEAFKQCATPKNIELIPDWYNLVSGHTKTSLSSDYLTLIAEAVVDKNYTLHEYVMPFDFVQGESYIKCNQSKMEALKKKLGF